MPLFESAFQPDALFAALDVLIKLGISVLLGGLIGYERELHGRPAGVRTHMLMCLGVTLFCEASRAFSSGGDPSRIASNIVTGVGFLGAGSILRMGIEVRGLTTAASIWAAAAIGMAVAIGGAFLWISIGATIMTLLTLSVVDRIEARLVPQHNARSLMIRAAGKECIPAILERLEESGFRVEGLEMEAAVDAVHLRIKVVGEGDGAVSACSKVPGVYAATWAE